MEHNFQYRIDRSDWYEQQRLILELEQRNGLLEPPIKHRIDVNRLQRSKQQRNFQSLSPRLFRFPEPGNNEHASGKTRVDRIDR